MVTGAAGAANPSAGSERKSERTGLWAWPGTLSRNWGWMLLRGVLALILGGLMIVLPWPGLLALTLVFAAYLIADGIAAIVLAVRAARRHERWGWFVFEGIAGIIAGALAFLLPGAAIVTLVALACVWAIVSGAIMAAAAWRLDAKHGRWWLFLAGLLSIVWGMLLFLQPIVGALMLAIWIGAYAAAFGVLLLVVSAQLYRCRKQERTAA